MPLTPEDVQNKRFRVTRLKPGYDEDEVDAFLDEVEAELRRLLAENDQLRIRAQAGGPPTRVAPPPAEPAAAPTPTTAPTPTGTEGQEAALRTLLLAQRTADEAVAQARAEADQLLKQAREQAASLEREAREKQAAQLAGLARQRQELETAIEGLRGFEREYRTRLRAYLQSQLKDLEGRSVEPAGGPALARPGTSPGTSPGTGPGTSPGGPGPYPGGPAAGAPPMGAPGVPAPGMPGPGGARREEGGPSDTDVTEVDERQGGPTG
jgi:DivIVA domain-containing protein